MQVKNYSSHIFQKKKTKTNYFISIILIHYKCNFVRLIMQISHDQYLKTKLHKIILKL